MKKTILVTLGSLLLAAGSFAQNFTEVLQKTFTAFDTTWNQQAKLEYANKLSLIARKFDKEWLASYYLAYAKVNVSYNEPDNTKKDAYLDEAQTAIDEAVRLLGKESDETHVMKAMIANARVGIDPQKRWQKYGRIFDEELDKAKEMNPNNGRIYTLRGISKFYTPKMFGGGKKAAIPYFEKAAGLYESQPKPDHIAIPYWGKGTNDYFTGLARGGEKEKE